MARFVSVCLSLDPKDIVTIPCDQFDVNEDGSISAYYNGELWGHFAPSEYLYAHIVDEEILAQLGLEDEDDDEDEDDEDGDELEDVIHLNGHVPVSTVEVVIPDDVSELAPATDADDDER